MVACFLKTVDATCPDIICSRTKKGTEPNNFTNSSRRVDPCKIGPLFIMAGIFSCSASRQISADKLVELILSDTAENFAKVYHEIGQPDTELDCIASGSGYTALHAAYVLRVLALCAVA